MTYGELKNYVLKLLNRYSVGGERVPLSYNDQADIAARIPELLRDGLQYVVTTGRCLREAAPLIACGKVGEFDLYQLPDDLYQLCGGLLRLQGGELSRYIGYRVAGGRQILIPASDKGTYMAEYFRYPIMPRGEPSDDDFIDCPPQAQMAIAYYVAAHLAMEDNNYLYAALHNEFELKMLRLREGEIVECGVVEDVYG